VSVLNNNDKLIEHLQNIDSSLHAIDKTLIKQEENLKEHMRRTELLEADLKPIKKHVSMIQGAGSLIVFISIIGGIVKLFLR
jgi:hypothetical protein